MLRHSLLLIYRNFKRFKTTFFINLIGLSTGLACALLIYLWVNDELKVDKFHEQDSRLYQVMKNNYEGDGIETDEDTPGILARSLLQEMGEVESAVSVFPPAAYTFNGILSQNNTYIKGRSKFADKAFFNIFTFPLIHGNADQALADKYGAVISEDIAMKLFNTTDGVIGRTLEWKGERNDGQFFVSGVFKTLPVTASIQFDIVFSYDLFLEYFPNFLEWRSNGPSTYVILDENTDIANFNDKIGNFVKLRNKESTLDLFVRPYSDRYLYGDYENGVQTGGRIEYVKLFSIVAVFILLIACINFMNLSTARASRRIKEVGIKKTIGASRRALILQYMGESLLMTFVSLKLTILMVDLLLPQFNVITGKNITLNFNPGLTLSLASLVLFTGLVAGSYPALYLSGFRPIAILKGGAVQRKNFTGELLARNGLVIFQFVISVILIVSVLVVYRQMEFIQTRNLGFDRDNIITFPVEGKVAEDSETFFSEIKKIPGIINASSINGDLTSMHGGTSAVDWEGKNPDVFVDFELFQVGPGLIETLEIEIKEGRGFLPHSETENSRIIFNEAAIESMGLINPVGQTIRLWGEEKEIIGVVKNFHFESLYENVKPLFFTLSPNGNRNMIVKIKAENQQETLARLGDFYKEYNFGIPFEYRFLDDDYQRLYVSEKRVATLAWYFSELAILISCLGLFGLAAFTVERRVKEIGIRKVLGSSQLGIVYLLSASLTKTVFAAIVIALPISYFATKQWLNSFAYKIELEWWYFAGVGILSLIIAWLTVGTQAFKAARVNPVKCLRDE
jgi:putative ABC transport system permease protein